MGVRDDQVRARLVGWFKDSGLTQKQFGQKFGWQQPTVSQYMLGDINTDLDTLAAMCRALGHTLSEALAETEPPVADPETADVMTLYRRLPPDAQAAVKDIMRTYPVAARPTGSARRSVRRPRDE